jgi:glycosidase
MQWRDVPGGGFADPDVVPWLPLSDLAQHNVESQRSDPDSILTLARDLIALRRHRPDLQGGRYQSLEAAVNVWAWSRGERTMVVMNMSDDEVAWGDVDGTIALCTDRRRDGEAIDGTLRLGPWVALVAERR